MQARKKRITRRKHVEKLPDVEVYKDTINPFSPTIALEYVREHKNIFAKRVTRRLVENSPDLIVVKEISTTPWGGKEVWFWGFTRDKRGIVKGTTDTEKAVEALRKALLGRKH